MEIRRVACIILYRDDGRILLQHRTADAPRNPNVWGLFGGGIEEGETPEQAVRREALEETEYVLKNPKLIDADTEEGSPYPNKYVFVEKYDPAQPIVLHEGQGYGWLTLEEALDLPMSTYRHDRLELLWSLILREMKNSGP